VHAAPQESPGGDHNRAGAKAASFESLDAQYFRRISGQKKSCNSALDCPQTRMLLQQGANSTSVKTSVALSARRPDRWTLAPIQHSELQRREICRSAHYSSESVDLTNDGALCHPADGGVTGHLTDSLQRARDQSNPRAKARSCDSGFRTGVAAANYDDIELVFN
jgi:hypothetical protein